MSFKALYDYCQGLGTHVPRNPVIKKVEELCGQKITYIRAGLDPNILLGFFVSAENKGHRLIQQTGGSNVIVIARGIGRNWERFVLFKEIMHMFDKPQQRTNSSAELGQLLTDFCASELTGEMSQQLQSEHACFWMAVAALCPEEARVRLQQQRDSGELSDTQIADLLKVPEKYVPAFFDARIKDVIAHITAE